MKLLVGSYFKNIYELEIKDNSFKNLKIISELDKPSYLLNDNPLSFIYNINELGYVRINQKDFLVNDTSCHISYNEKYDRYYISNYGAGSLSVIANDSIKKIKFKEHSHIHYASYIKNINLTGVVDLGDNKLHLLDESLNIVTSFNFPGNPGPRHFISSETLPIIYVISEHITAIYVLEYKDKKLVLLEKHLIGAGHGSAIRIADNYLYAAVRTSNMIFTFRILKNGLLEIIQKVHSYGNHPRDFNISFDNKYCVVLNMHSDNLTLFKIIDGKLFLLEKDFYLKEGASVIFNK